MCILIATYNWIWLLQFVRFHKFNIYIHFILSNKYNVFKVLRCSVRPKLIVRVEGTDTICYAWRQYIYISVYFHIYPSYYKMWRQRIVWVKCCGSLAVSIFSNMNFIYLLHSRSTQWRSLSKRLKFYDSVASVPRNYRYMFISNPSSEQTFTGGTWRFFMTGTVLQTKAPRYLSVSENRIC